MGLIRLADWTEQLWAADISRALTLEPAAPVTPTGLYRVGGAAVRPAAAAMEEGGMMMINFVATLNACSFTVNKNKPKASSRQQPPQQQASQQSQSNGPRDVGPASVAEGEREDLSIQQLRGLLAASNCRFEALAIVLQQTLVEVIHFLFMVGCLIFEVFRFEQHGCYFSWQIIQ